MKPLLDEYGRSAWEFAWACTGRTDAAVSCLAQFQRKAESEPPPAQEPERRRAAWRLLMDACRQQVSARPPGSPESADPRLAALLELPLEMREALVLLRFHGASGEDLAAALGASPQVALGQAQRALSRIALARALPSP